MDTVVELELTSKEPDANHTQICASFDVEHHSDYETTELGKDQSHQYTDETKREFLFEELKKTSLFTNKEGLPARYRLSTEKQYVDPDKHVRRWTFGKKDESKKSRTIILVGETGTGKTTLINSLVNYLLGVEKEDNVWFEISEVSEVNDVISKEEHITVYDVFTKALKFNLCVIDTPGYGNIEGLKNDKNISEWLLKLLNYFDKTTPCPLDVVGLVVTATQNRLHDRQLYIFDAVQSLFGSNVKENIVVFVTHANELIHQNVLTAIEKANIPVAKSNNKPVHFMYDNIQSERQCVSKELYNAKWEMGQRSTEAFVNFLDTLETQSLEKTKIVLTQRQALEERIKELKDCVASIHKKQIALEEEKKKRVSNEDFKYEDELVYNEMVPMSVKCWNIYKVTSCSVCKVNCHSKCWGICNPRHCRVMKKKRCTVCTGRCASNKHVTEHSKYVPRKVKKTNEGKHTNYMKQSETIKEKDVELKKEIQDKLDLLERAYTCVTELEKNALKSNTLLTQLHLDFLIEIMEETGKADRVQKLRELRKRNDLEDKAMNYVKVEMCDL